MHIGSTISHYKIVEKLGEGGMGVVYKADDTKLNRQVALKFLAEHLLSDPEAKERFLREAQAAAALHHPNVCPVHEIDEVDGKTFLAMAFLEGESLEDRIAQGPLSIKEALDIARQVAEGLEAAHEKGIVHRDIKPANVMVDAKDHATIMDFGLARLTEASRLTKVDTAMGTVAYMSPEQAQGMEVDSRSDIWALGCVLYEMVSGQRPFLGQYDQALLYEIVHEEPQPLTGLRTGVPVELELLVAKCLEKERDDRYGSAQEVSRDLRKLGEKLRSGRSTILRTAQMTGAVTAAITGAQTLNPASTLPPDAVVVAKRKLRLLQALAVVFAIAFFGVLVAYYAKAPFEELERPVGRFSLTPEGFTRASISPDGKYILYAAETDEGSGLWLRSFSDESARQLPGTEGAIDGFWSPDSSSIGFVAGTSSAWELKRVPITGGSPITLCQLPVQTRFQGGTWSPDGESIVVSSGLRLYEVAARGGQPRLLFDPSSEPRPVAIYPHFLPTGGSPALVYSAAITPADRQVAVLNLETGERRELGPGSAPVYSQDGYLIHGTASSAEPGLWATPFSTDTLETTGESFPISSAGFLPSVSRDGTLIFRDQPTGVAAAMTLVWRDRAGEILETAGQPQVTIGEIALSPDGQRVAVRSNESGNGDIWIHDLSRSTKTRLTFEDFGEANPTWSPSGSEIAYRTGAQNQIVRRAVDGSGEASPLVQMQAGTLFPSDWSRDGRYVIYVENDPRRPGLMEVRYLTLGNDGQVGEPVTFLASAANERNPKISPDGRYLAYQSDESGRDEIYVRPFPSGGGKWQASVNGGTAPRWRGDGRELYYVEGETLMAVSVASEPAFTVLRPQKLFQADFLDSQTSTVGGYDVSSDGQRFLTVEDVAGAESTPPRIRIVQNWYEEFRDRSH